MPGQLEGKVALVTGSGRGIGQAEALALSGAGANVVVNDLGVARDGLGRDTSPADETVARIAEAGGEAVANYDDITSLAGGENLVRQAVDAFGRLDILVNNAGIQINRLVSEITEEEWDRTIAIHIKGHWSTIKAAIPIFRDQGGGCIINTASMAGLGQLRHVDYVTAKEAIVGMTRGLALELEPFGIRVNNIRPRATTRMVTERRADEMGSGEARRPSPPATGNQDPAMVGNLVVFLASEMAADISGNDIFVQGDEIAVMSLPQKQASVFREGGFDPDSIGKAFGSSLKQAVRKPVSY